MTGEKKKDLPRGRSTKGWDRLTPEGGEGGGRGKGEICTGGLEGKGGGGYFS